jgi:hypothetical protein
VLETRINEITEENIETQNQGAAGNETENATGESNEIGRNNGTGGNSRPIFRGINTRRRRSNDQTEEVASTVLNRAPNPYARREETHRNDGSEAPRPTPRIPVAEMRSNDAPQDDSMPVGNVIGLARSPDRSGVNSEETARTAATNINRVLLREARRDSAARYRISREMYPELGTPREERARDQQQQQVIGNGRSIHSTAPRPSMEMLQEATIMSPLAIDPELSIWPHPDGYLLFENRRRIEAPEAVVLLDRILKNPTKFKWPILKPLSVFDQWLVAVTAASLLTGVYNDEPRNRHAIFASDIFLVSSMMTLVDLITKDYSARGFFRQHQNAQHFILNSDTAYPMMNKDMLSKSDLRKLTGNLLDPQACLKVMIMWIQRIYSFHTVALIDQVNTWVEPSRLRDILFKPGAFHEWATEIIPDVIFAPPHPANAEHIWERIQEERQLELEHQSLQSLDNEMDSTSLQEGDGGYEDLEDNIRVTQGQGSISLEAEATNGSIQVVTAELISDEQANEIAAQAESSGGCGAAMERHGIEEALNQAQETGEAVVLAGMHGAPAEVAGFRVTEYIELDVPSIPTRRDRGSLHESSDKLHRNELSRRKEINSAKARKNGAVATYQVGYYTW